MPASPRRRRRVAAAAVLLPGVLVLGVGCSPDDGGSGVQAPSSRTPVASASSEPDGSTATPADYRAIERLLARRAAAVLSDDRRAFLATLDPGNRRLRERQADLFANLSALPVGRLHYAVGRDGYRPARLAGRGPRLRPPVVEHLSLRGIWRRPVGNQLSMTFVRRDGRWLVGAEAIDEDFAPQERPWFGGRVDVGVGDGLIALTDDDGPVPADDVLAAVRDDLGSLEDLLGRSGAGLLVDATSNGRPHEISNASGKSADAVTFGVYATDELGGSYDGRVGSAVKLNPVGVDRIVDDRVTMRHELTHFLLPGTGSAPVWATEGIAEYVAYHPYRLVNFDLDDDTLATIAERDVELTPTGRWGEDPAADYLLAEATAEYLVDTYGIDRYLRMLAVFERRGRDRPITNGEGIVDDVLRRVYGEGETAVARAARSRLGLE